MCKLVCLEAPHSAEQVFIDSYFVSEMRVLADDQIFELVNSTAANTVFYDAKNTPWACNVIVWASVTVNLLLL